MRSVIGTPRGRLLAALASVLLAPLALAALPSEEKLEALRGRAKALSYEVKLVTLEDRTTWIESETEVEAVFMGSLEDALAILEDYENSPRVFSRIEAVRVRSSTPDGVTVTEQRSAVRVLGLAYVTNLVFRCEVAREGGDRATLTFRMIDGDGSARSSEGSWTIEPARLGSEEAVYLRYRCSMLVERRFPMQLEIMRSFGKADFEKMVLELGKALDRRKHGQ